MVVTIIYRRGIRIAPYEPLLIGIEQEFTGEYVSYEKEYQGLKAQVDKWLDEAYEEFKVIE